MCRKHVRYKKGTGRKYLQAGAVILFSLTLAACAEGSEASQVGVIGAAGTINTSEAETSGALPAQKETQEQTQVKDKLPGGNTSMPNPIKEVSSSADFESIGLKLELPANQEWYSGPAYSLISGKAAQIHFCDEITGSDAIVRAAKSEEGDISGIYYVFDDSKQQSWSTKTEDGTKVDIKVQVTAENSDVHGALATWFYKDISYSLWEDDARELPDAVAKMAIEIMRVSDPENENE